jgi:hypothetical protein
MNSPALDVARAVEAAAVELVHRHSLDEIENVLVASGISAEVAAKAVLLIPSAFAAVQFEREGVAFPSEFSVGPPEAIRRLSYSNEPLYQEARGLAERWLLEGRPALVARVIDWSAEASAIKEARAKGLHPSRMSEVHHGEWWA